jgi:hypothetical protein
MKGCPAALAGAGRVNGDAVVRGEYYPKAKAPAKQDSRNPSAAQIARGNRFLAPKPTQPAAQGTGWRDKLAPQWPGLIAGLTEEQKLQIWPYRQAHDGRVIRPAVPDHIAELRALTLRYSLQELCDMPRIVNPTRRRR